MTLVSCLAMAMKMVEECKVSAPRGSVPTTALPLSFFDIPWIHSHPMQRLFLFDFPHQPTPHFLHSLKHSLSLSLQHFFPFSGHLLLPSDHLLRHPHILFHDGDSIPFTVAESSSDFSLLISHTSVHFTLLHHLVPTLPPSRATENGDRFIPLMAIQVTIFPNSGLAIGITFAHVTGDGRSFNHFIKFWSSICSRVTSGDGDLNTLFSSLPLPCHARNIIQDPNGFKRIWLNDLKKNEEEELAGGGNGVSSSDKLLATFLLTRDQIEKLKKWIFIRCMGNNETGELHVSTFVLTCSLMWVCLIKSEESQDSNLRNSLDQVCNLVFLVDCRNHSEFTIPSNYFGNCLIYPCVTLKRGVLVGENGFVEAVKAVESHVREMKRDPLKGIEKLDLDFRKKKMLQQSMLIIAGSPSFGAYQTDFGWGKPRKSIVVHIEFSDAIYLNDSRNNDVAIEIGVALNTTQMNIFSHILEKQLKNVDTACE